MLVYGDPQYRISAKVFLSAFKERVKRTCPDNLDELRALLIQAGQFEQGMADAGQEGGSPGRPGPNLTDKAAEAFARVWDGGTPDLSRLAVDDPPDAPITIKIPEGYEFYALHPEQYMQTAKELAKERADQRALVVGIRSIGTSLSAAVSAVLKNSRRCTVRPQGDPFERQASQPPLDPTGFDYVVIVDEGPGLSGASIAGVWRALREAGAKEIIAIPGHNHGPGTAASETTRALWRQMKKRFIPAQELSGRDLSAGKWRALISGDWPPAFVPFERTKYLSEDGGTLWKFAGLGAAYENGKTALENAWARMQALASEGFGLQPLETRRGFIAMPWIDGTRLTKADARDPGVLDLLSDYVVRFAGLPLDPEEMRAGQDRLAQMAIVNTREALGDKWARIAEQKLEQGRDLHMFQSYGDGRLAPHEWVRSREGRIFKVDNFGHDTDHTVVGKQSIAWDFAGLILEWELSQTQTEGLLKSLLRQGACLAPEVLQFYEIAYAAFHMGLSNFCGSQTTDKSEQQLLKAAEKSYCHKLLQTLSEERLAMLSAAVSRLGHGVPGQPRL